MNKLLLLFFLCLFVVACEKKEGCESSDSASVDQASECSADSDQDPAEPEQPEGPEQPEPQPPRPLPPQPQPPQPPIDDVPEAAKTFKAKVVLEEFDKEDTAKVNKAIEIIKKVVASKEFRDKVLNFTYNKKKQFVDNNGLTNAQIYQKLLEGKEELRPVIDNEMDLELELYYSMWNTVGYTTPDELRIYMNTKFFYSYTPAEVAGNVFHEWTHKLGFDHDSSYSVSRDSSVPYALGYIMEELGKKYEK